MHTKTMTTAGDVKKTLARVAPAVNTKTTIAALRCIRIGDGTIAATDMVAHVTAPFPAAADVEPALVVFADVKRAIGALKTSDPVTFESTDDGLAMTTPRGRVVFPAAVELDEWPDVTESAFPFAMTPADPESFTRVLLDVSSVTSGDESRPVLQATMLDSSATETRFAATDSYRLAMDSEPSTGDAFRVLLPDVTAYMKKTCIVRVESSHASPEDAAVADPDVLPVHRVEPRQFVRLVDADGSVTIMRATIGSFPDPVKLMPGAPESVVDVPADLLDAVTFAKKVIGASRNPLRLEFIADRFTMTAAVQDGPSTSATFDAGVGDDSEHVTIGFSADFLADGLAFTGPCTLALISPLRPGLLESVERPSRSYLLMPVRLPD